MSPCSCTLPCLHPSYPQGDVTSRYKDGVGMEEETPPDYTHNSCARISSEEYHRQTLLYTQMELHNLYQERFHRLERQQQRWRRNMMWIAGGVVVINIMLFNVISSASWNDSSTSTPTPDDTVDDESELNSILLSMRTGAVAWSNDLQRLCSASLRRQPFCQDQYPILRMIYNQTQVARVLMQRDITSEARMELQSARQLCSHHNLCVYVPQLAQLECEVFLKYGMDRKQESLDACMEGLSVSAHNAPMLVLFSRALLIHRDLQAAWDALQEAKTVMDRMQSSTDPEQPTSHHSHHRDPLSLQQTIGELEKRIQAENESRVCLSAVYSPWHSRYVHVIV